MINSETQSQPTTLTPQLGILRFVPTLYQVAFLAILGAILIVAMAPRLDTDFWWHLKDGQYIALNHVVPARDFMSYTLTGHAWTDHEWLAEVWLYVSYRIAGLWGPIAMFAAVICATFTLVYARMTAMKLNKVLVLFMVASAFMASSASWGPRIQMMTLMFLAAFSLILDAFSRTRNRRLLFTLPLLMLFWTNIHGGFVLGLVLITITLAGEWLNRLTRLQQSWSTHDLRALALTLGGTVAVTMVNPNSYRQLLYPLTFVLPNAYTNLIEESASPNFHLPVMMLFEAFLLVLVAAFFVGRPRLNWTHLFLVLAFTHLALSQVRNVAIWAVVISPLVALYIQGAIPELQRHFPAFSYRRRPVSGRIGPILNLTLLAVIALAYVLESTHFVNATTLRTAEQENYPRGAVAYMQSHSLPQHTFVSYGWGGYMLWNLFPRYRDYMDSRADTLYTNAILHDYLNMYSAKPNWNAVLRHRDVRNVLVEPTAPLAQVLAQDRGWRLVYSDAVSVLYTVR